jgi:Tol biopolymer transport system component
MNKQTFLLYVLLITPLFSVTAEQTITIQKTAAEKITIALVLTDQATATTKLINTITHDLERSEQFTLVKQQQQNPILKERDMLQLATDGYSLALFISCNDIACTWRLYDTIGMTMIKGKQKELSGENNIYKDAHAIAEDMWLALVGAHASFSLSIAYIKRLGSLFQPRSYELWSMDSGGQQKSRIYSSYMTIVAPSWTIVHQQPHILFSEFTRFNVRIVAVDLTGHKRIVLDRDGTCVGVSFVPGTGDVVYARSGALWEYHYDSTTNHGSHSIIIKEHDVCASPVVIENGDVLYCCAGSIKCWSRAHKTITTLTTGYAVAPSYAALTKTLVYAKRVNGVMQIYMMDMNTKKHTKITNDPGDKIDPSISPCGNYVTFACQKGKKSRIALQHLYTSKRIWMTNADEYCYAPSWEPFELY